MLRRWWRAEHDWETTQAEVDLRIGGTVRVVMRNPTRASNTAAAAPTPWSSRQPAWRSPGPGTATRQTLIELEFEENDGITTVRFTHSGLWDEEAVRSHEDGWRNAFDNLDRALEAARR